jgi:hypothetical protein
LDGTIDITIATNSKIGSDTTGHDFLLSDFEKSYSQCLNIYTYIPIDTAVKEGVAAVESMEVAMLWLERTDHFALSTKQEIF